MATIRIDIAAENRARREILDIRQQITELNAQIARNNRSVAEGTAEERRNVAEKNRVIRAEQGLLRVQQQRTSISLLRLREETGLLANVRQQTDLLSRATRGLGGAFAGVGQAISFLAVDQLVFQLQQLAAGSVRASVQLDSQTRALAVLTGSLREAEEAMRDVQMLADLPGLRFREAIDGTVALRAIGVEAETVTRILTELGNAAAFSGGEGEFQRGLLGFRQLIQRGRLSQEELNQLTENIGLASRVLREEFGTVLAEDIQAQLDATGQSIDDFVERTLSGFERLERFPLDAPSVALKNLSNSVFELQAAIGDQFLPVLASGARGLTAFLDNLRELISGTDEATESITNFRDAIVEADNAIERDDAIQTRIRFLREYIEELEEANRQRGIFDNRGRGIAEAEIAGESAELSRLERIQIGDPEIIAELTAEVERLDAALVENEETLTDLERTANRFSESQSRNFDIRRENLAEEASALFEQRELRESELQTATEAAQGVADAEREKAQAAEDAATAQQVALDSLNRSTEYSIQLAQNAREAEVARWEEAAETGASYAEQLRELATLSERRAFVEFVNQLQEQGVGFDEARMRASEYVQTLGAADERRIRSATAARAAEVDGFETAAESGAEYAALLGQIGSFSERRAFVALVESLQEQGLSFREALSHAERYINVLDQRIPRAIDDASGSLREFSLASQDAFQGSADTIANLTGNIIELGGQIRNVLDDVGSFDRAFIGFGRDITPEGTGFSVRDDQQRAGLAGRQYIARNFPNQAQELGITQGGGDGLGGLSRAGTQLAGLFDQMARDLDNEWSNVLDAASRSATIIEDLTRGDYVGAAVQAVQWAWDWSQESRAESEEALRIIRERERIQNENRVNFYFERIAFEEEQRYRNRLSTLTDTGAAFDDWTEALQDVADTDLGRTAEVFSAFATEMDRVNAAVNAARLSLEPLASSAAYNTLQRIAEGRPSFGAELAAPTDAQEQGVVSTIGGVPVDAAGEPIDIERLIREAQRRAEAIVGIEMRYADTVQGIYNDVAEAYADAEERKTEIAEDAAQDRIDADAELAETQQDIYNSVAQEYERVEERKTEISERAAADRTEAENRYTETVQDIYNDVAEAYEDAEERKTEIAERAAEQRADVDADLVETQQDIYNDVAEAYEDAEERKTEIAEDAAQDRIDSEQAYQDTVQEIYNDVADAFADAQQEATEILERATQQRADIDERLADTQQDIYRDVADAHFDTEERKTEIEERAAQDRMDAQQRYADTVQDVYNNLATQVTQINEDLIETLAELQQDALDVESQRLDDLVELREDAAARIEQIERGTAESQADSRRSYFEDIQDLQNRLARRQFGVVSFGELDEQQVEQLRASQDFLTAVEDIRTRQRRDFAGFDRREQERIAAIQVSTAEQVAEINEQSAAEQMEIATAQTDAETDAAEAITAAETAAGTTAAEAIEKFVMPANAMTSALNALNTTLAEIDAAEISAIDTEDENFLNFIDAAGVDLPTALANAEPPMTRMAIALETHAEALDAINTGEQTALGGVGTAFAEVLETAGVPLTVALNNAQEPMTRMAVALEEHTTRLDAINTAESTAITGVDDAFAEVLETAGVPLTDALNNAVEPMDRWTMALDRHAAAIMEINTAESTAITGIDNQFGEVLDRAGVPLTDALNNAVAPLTLFAAAGNTLSTTLDRINNTETSALADLNSGMMEFVDRAGVPLTDALNNAVEPMDRWTMALDRHAAAIMEINTAESTAITGIDDAFAEVLETAGVPLTVALNQAQPPMSRLAEALETYNTNFAEITQPATPVLPPANPQATATTDTGMIEQAVSTAISATVSAISVRVENFDEFNPQFSVVLDKQKVGTIVSDEIRTQQQAGDTLI